MHTKFILGEILKTRTKLHKKKVKLKISFKIKLISKNYIIHIFHDLKRGFATDSYLHRNWKFVHPWKEEIQELNEYSIK